MSANRTVDTELLVKANELRLQGGQQAALALYLSAAEHLRDNADLLAVIANLYFTLALSDPGRGAEYYSHALAHQEQAVKLQPDAGHLHAILGQYYWLGRHDHAQAVREYRKALEFDPNDILAMTGIAMLYGAAGLVASDEAIEALERASHLDVDTPVYHARLAELYRDGGDFERSAEQTLRALLCLQPLDRGYVRRLGTATSQ